MIQCQIFKIKCLFKILKIYVNYYVVLLNFLIAALRNHPVKVLEKSHRFLEEKVSVFNSRFQKAEYTVTS